MLRPVIAEFTENEDLLRAYALSEIELSALEAMELRSLQPECPLPIETLYLQARTVLENIGALIVESFGYYALPYSDPQLMHNEPPLAWSRSSAGKPAGMDDEKLIDEQAERQITSDVTQANQNRLRQCVANSYLALNGDLRDVIARQQLQRGQVEN